MNTSHFLPRQKRLFLSEVTQNFIPISMIVSEHWMAHTLQQRYLKNTQQHIEIDRAGYLKMCLHVVSLTICCSHISWRAGKDRLTMEQYWKQHLMRDLKFLLGSIIWRMLAMLLPHTI